MEVVVCAVSVPDDIKAAAEHVPHKWISTVTIIFINVIVSINMFGVGTHIYLIGSKSDGEVEHSQATRLVSLNSVVIDFHFIRSLDSISSAEPAISFDSRSGINICSSSDWLRPSQKSSVS